jgi:cyclohexa-1,5-dienecarbonyl-CoA hydratase
MSDFYNIEFSVSAPKAELIFNRPPHNTLNTEMMDEITEALLSLRDQESLKICVISAAGELFSTGIEASEHNEAQVEKFINAGHEMFRALDILEMPTIALLHGEATGLGCQLALACNLVLAAENIRLGQPEIKAGLFPPAAAAGLPKNIGLKTAYELVLTGELISAQEAKSLGLVNKVFPSKRFKEEAEKFIEKITANSAEVLRLTKRAVNSGLGFSFLDGMKRAERVYLNELMFTSDANEGIQAYLEGRPPVWKDK